MAYRTYSTVNGFIVAQNGTGDFTTISDAITAILARNPANPIIFLTDLSYTENFTCPQNVVITATNNCVIYGTVTINTPGTINLRNINLITNSTYALVLSGSSNSKVLLFNSTVVATNHNAISFVNTNASSNIFFELGATDIQNASFTLYEQSSPGKLVFSGTSMNNSGLSPVSSNNSAGSVFLNDVVSNMLYSNSGSGAFSVLPGCVFNSNLAAVLNFGGSGINNIYNSIVNSGTQVSINITSNCLIDNVDISSDLPTGSCITGTGVLTYGVITFGGTNNSIANTLVLAALQTNMGEISLINAPTKGSLLYVGSTKGPLIPLTPSNNGDVLQIKSGVPSWSTPTFPITVGGTGTILRSDGTNWAATTATYPTTTTINQILYSSSANTIGGLATANNAVVNTSGTGVPSMTTYPQITGLGIGASPGTTAGLTFDGTYFMSAYATNTFTPTILGASTAGTTTYSSQVGVYVKIGRFVYFSAYVVWSAATGTGVITMGGLPFTSSGALAFVSCTVYTNVSIATSTSYVCYVNNGATTVSLIGAISAAGTQVNSSLAANTNNYLYVSGYYLSAS